MSYKPPSRPKRPPKTVKWEKHEVPREVHSIGTCDWCDRDIYDNEDYWIGDTVDYKWCYLACDDCARKKGLTW